MKILNSLAFALIVIASIQHTFAQQQLTSFADGTSEGSNPAKFFPYENQLLFVAISKHIGGELWKTDGTSEGTILIKDINLGSGYSTISNFTLYKGKVYFTADDNSKGQQLWVTDGTSAGTKRVTSIGSGITQMVADDNAIYFLRYNLDYLQVWKSDGTSSGTIMVKGDIKIWNSAANLTMADGLAYFSCQPFGVNESRVWRSDGTADGTFPITPPIDGNGSGPSGTSHPTQFVEYNGSLYFIARGGAFPLPQSGLMKTDGTVAGTVAVKSLHSGSAIVNYSQGFEYNDKMYFTFFEVTTRRFSIVESDGTTANTTTIFDQSYPNYFSPGQTLARDGFLYFTAGDGAKGTALVKLNLSDRTYETQKTLSNTTEPFIFVAALDKNASAGTTSKMFFQSRLDIGVTSLWATEGTIASTVSLLDDQMPGELAALNNKVYFSRASAAGTELWSADGTPSATTMVKDINTAVYGLTNAQLVSNGSQAIFYASDKILGMEPRITDGTLAGTKLLKDIAVGTRSSYEYTKVSVNGKFVFPAIDNSGMIQYYGSDGTDAGTVAITSFTENKSVHNIVVQGDGKLCYFDVLNRDNTTSLYVSDGTVAGTKEIENLGTNGVGGAYYITEMSAGSNRLYFAVAGFGEDLWKSDGTADGTVKVADLTAISELVVSGDKAYFTVQSSASLSDVEVYVSDGTEAGTKLIKDLNGSKSSEATGLTAFNGKVVFSANDEATGRELWITDGTEAGTALVKDVLPGAESSIVRNEFVVYQNRVYFIADDGTHGPELWSSSGTPETTTLVKDIVPGTESSVPGKLKALDDLLYFQAYTPENGVEVWSTDGTANNTKLLVDVIPGAEHSNPFGFVKVNDKLVFFADTQSKGVQLWGYSPETSGPVTAVEDLEAVFSIYPNPSAGVYRVHFSEGTTAVDVHVYSTDGKSIPAKLNGDGTLDLCGAPVGVYLIKINSGSQSFVRRVVKF
ncbi:ELWxxDGT repeat protein [Chryseolinea sp. T2]|uniref:ELWxxDGT repeat protein n=1 Tax=Chryseolinea sp. T2 TaxID=3129255 RepID=UPI0030776531